MLLLFWKHMLSPKLFLRFSFPSWPKGDVPAFSCILLPCEHLPGSKAFFITVPPQETDREARAGGRVKHFGSSRNESLKDGLLYWWKWIEIPWQRKEAEFSSLHDLKGTIKAWHRTPRHVLEGNCCVQVPPERHEQGTLAPAQGHSLVGVTKIQLFSLGVFGLSCDGGTQGFNQLQTNAPQRLWLEKQLLFPPGCPLYLQNMLFTVKQSLSHHQ